ncbi:MAG: methionyl-tRNA synthetase [Polaribacter sp.]|jgi:methionyl-tRNA synthetase
MKKPKRYLITSALPYANGSLHLGHLAGAYLSADIYARYLRLQGEEVLFVCGSDEHGAAITIRAKKEGVTPESIINKYHELNKETFNKLGISFDIYHRTSDPLHHETAQDFFKTLYDKGGEFEERESEQLYDEENDQFLADRYVIGECPKCGNSEAYGDQCENCGTTLSPSELINPKSTISGNTPVLKKTKHWYFKLDKHEGWLRDWIKDGTLDGVEHHNPKEWKKHVVGQCLSWLDGEGGLQPRAITRDLSWGIPVPLKEAEGKVLYVWFDAPIGYISATKQWAKDNDRDWKDYWQSEDSQLVHFIGKDNIVFHCIVFPAMLKAHGDYQLPINVPANQFLNFEGDKFSKSKGWGIEQHEYMELFKDFENKEDALRYALVRNMPENRDSDFKWDDFMDFYDKELADNLGNFVNRVIVLTNKYYEGVVPESDTNLTETLKDVNELLQKLDKEIESYSFKSATQIMMEISSWGNTYLQDVSPWKIWKEEPNSSIIKESLFISLQIVGILSVICKPFVPFTSDKIRSLLNLSAVGNGDWKALEEKLNAGEAILPQGHKIGEPDLLFQKINDRKDKSRLEIIEAEKAKLATLLAEKNGPERPALKPTISFDDFTKMDIRVGTITAAKKVEKSSKLLHLTVDLGFEERTVLSGIAKFYKAEEVIGQEVLLLANLAPRKMMGVESQGMVLMAEDGEGKLCFVSPDKGWATGFGVS